MDWRSCPLFFLCAALVGCATPQYAVRSTPAPEESAAAIQIERQISAIQGKAFERQRARPIGFDEELRGLPIQQVIDRLSRVTERPTLRYRAYLYQDRDPNAAALADGRIYLSSGMLEYLENRGSRVDEFAFIVGHEMAHTVAQHLVKRYRMLQQQQLMMALLAAGASAATHGASNGVQQAGRLAMDAASMLADVAESGYSQDQELEADQLGIRYVIKTGYDPRSALDLLQDFARFDVPWPFLRTHPYITTRREYLQRYLLDTGQLGRSAPLQPTARNETVNRLNPHTRAGMEVKRLRDAQQLYPVDSVSWKNLQRQIEVLEQR